MIDFKDIKKKDKIIEKLYKQAKFINENVEPNIDDLVNYIEGQIERKDLKGLNLYGKCLDILLQLP